MLLVALSFFGDVPEHTRFWEALFDAGHAPLFGAMALIVRSLLRREKAPRVVGPLRLE